MNTRKQKLISLTASVLALLALAALLFVWWTRSSYGPWGRVSALLCAALFAVLGWRFMPRWVSFWSGETLSEAPADAEPRRMGARIFPALLAADALVLFAAWLLRRAPGCEESFVQSLSFWTCTDSQHYLAIAEDWYLSEGELGRLVQMVFLPGYPILVRLFHLITGEYLIAGLLVSALCFAGAGVLFYRLLRLDLPHEDALRALLLLCLLPGSFFYASPMSESLFLLTSLACVYLARKGRWWAAGLCGAWACFTRSLGLMLLVPLLMELIAALSRRELTGKKAAGRFAALLLLPLGFAAYCLINYLVSGNPFQFLIYQAEHWSQHLGFFFNTAAYQAERAVTTFSGRTNHFFGLWLPNLLYVFLAPAAVAAAAKKLRPSYTAWFIAYYVIAVGATWLLSAPRYLMAMPALPAALALLTKKDGALSGTLIALTLLWPLYFLAFLLRWQVW